MSENIGAEKRSGPRYVAYFPVRAEWDDEESGAHVVSVGATENVGPAGRPLVSAQTARNNLRLRHWGDVVRLAGGAEFEQLEKRRSQPMRAAPPQEVTPIAGQGWELVDRFERGRRIHYLRTSLNWTMEQLGDRAGVNRASISNMESGKREGGLEMLLGVARAFNVSLDLLGRASRDHFELAVRPIFDPVAGPAALALGTLGPAEIGRRVRSVRHLHGWTQGVLASRAGLASSGTGFQDRGGPGHRDQQQRRQTGSGAGPPVRRARRSEVGRLSGCGAGSGERRDGLTY